MIDAELRGFQSRVLRPYVAGALGHLYVTEWQELKREHCGGRRRSEMLLLLASRSANARVEAGAVATFVVPTTAPMEMEGGSKRTFVLGMPCMTGHHTVSPVLLLNLALRLVQSQLDTPQPLWLLSAGVFYPRARGAIRTRSSACSIRMLAPRSKARRVRSSRSSQVYVAQQEALL